MRTSNQSNCKSNCLQRPCVPWNKHKRLDLSWQYLRKNGEGQHPGIESTGGPTTSNLGINLVPRMGYNLPIHHPEQLGGCMLTRSCLYTFLYRFFIFTLIDLIDFIDRD